MNVRLVEVDGTDVRLRHLAQLYHYDFSEFMKADVAGDGLYRSIGFETSYRGDSFERYLIEVDGKLAGFVIVSLGQAYRDPAEQVWWIDEFFVMRAYRRRGVGERAARELFKRGGAWEVGQVAPNTAGQAFWRSIIDRYTNGAYEEIVLDDDRWRGPVQYFTA